MNFPLDALGYLFTSLTLISAVHCIYRIKVLKNPYTISIRTFALFFALNVFLFYACMLSAKWELFALTAISTILNGTVIVYYLRFWTEQ